MEASLLQKGVAAIEHYRRKGIAVGPAIGIVSVLSYESALNPGPQGHQSTETPGVLNPYGAYGLASWNGPRQNALKVFATKKGLPVEDINTQLDFVLTESANSYPSVWAAIQSGLRFQEFIPLFVRDYENPADIPRETNGSIVLASQYEPCIPLTEPAPVPSTPSSPHYSPPPVSIPLPEAFPMNPVLAQILIQLAVALGEGLISGIAKQMQSGGIQLPVPLSQLPQIPQVQTPQSSAPASVSGDLLQQIVQGVATALGPIITGQKTG